MRKVVMIGSLAAMVLGLVGAVWRDTMIAVAFFPAGAICFAIAVATREIVDAINGSIEIVLESREAEKRRP